MATTSPAIPTTVSVQSVRSTYAYGGAQRWPAVQSSASNVLLRVAVPAFLPKTAVIVSATVWIAQKGDWTGSTTLTLRRNSTAFSSTTTWAKKPVTTDTAHPLTKSAPLDGTWWGFDVTADVQGFVAGTKTNYGWNLSSGSATKRTVAGAAAPELVPYMELVYSIPGEAPTGLSPAGGAVSVAKPVLTFDASEPFTALQVQVDPASNVTTPAFDSGEVPAVGGVLDLAGTAYAGLADLASTTWRVRVKGDLGWGPWSGWATFSRDDLPTVAFVSPGATVEDTTPPYSWTVTGATQAAWQARLLDDAGKVLADSGQVAGTGTTWTPPQGFTQSGQTGTAEVHVWDAVVRVATSGAPTYAAAVRAVSVVFSSSVTPMTSVGAAQSGPSPVVHLTGARSAGTPDEVIVFRNGVQIARLAGVDAFTGTAFAWDDWTAPMNLPATYRVAPVVNNSTAAGGPSTTLTPVCQGLWIADPVDGVGAVLWGDDPGDWSNEEVATVHQPIGRGQPPVRRRLNRPAVSGSLTGAVMDAVGVTGDAVVAVLKQYAANDPGRVYRLIAGRDNLPVLIGDVSVVQTPRSGTELVATARVSFWGL